MSGLLVSSPFNEGRVFQQGEGHTRHTLIGAVKIVFVNLDGAVKFLIRRKPIEKSGNFEVIAEVHTAHVFVLDHFFW